MPNLMNQLNGCPSFAAVLAAWCGVPRLELQVTGSTTTKPSRLRPQITYTRTGLLRLPSPSSRPVAQVEASVTLELLPLDVVAEITAGKRLLGEILIKAGATRKTTTVRKVSREDESGEKIHVRVLANFKLEGQVVATVTEDVYAWVPLDK